MNIWKKQENPGARMILVGSLLCCGCGFSWQSCLLGAILCLAIAGYTWKNRALHIWASPVSLAAGLIVLGYFVSVPGAVDRQMALWGCLKFLPVALITVWVMQLEEHVRIALLRSLPAIGSVLVVLSLICSRIPAMQEYVLVNGRLAGTFEYPNSFALFLLVCLLILIGDRKKENVNGTGTDVEKVCMAKIPVEKRSGLCDLAEGLLLLAGIACCGSRTVYVILAVLLILAPWILPEKKQKHAAAVLLLLCLLAVPVLLWSDLSGIGTRLAGISLSESTFLGRLLYWKDALPVIARHPLGLGYMGYFYTQGSFQSGVYSVTHAHNEWIQLALDAGWIPAIALAVLFVQGIRKAKSPGQRLALLAMALHCMMDFDLQYMALWIVLILMLPVEEGRCIHLPYIKAVGGLGITAALAGIYFSIGGYLINDGVYAASDWFYPKDTSRQLWTMTYLTEGEEQTALAEQLLENNACLSAAWQILAEAAFWDGDMTIVIQDMQQAITYSRYTKEYYENYLIMLSIAAEAYQEQVDQESLQRCIEEAASIPEQLLELQAQTSELASRLDDKPDFTLSEEAQEELESILALQAPAQS